MVRGRVTSLQVLYDLTTNVLVASSETCRPLTDSSLVKSIAIRFVLSDAYTNMGREERQALLHVMMTWEYKKKKRVCPIAPPKFDHAALSPPAIYT